MNKNYKFIFRTIIDIGLERFLGRLKHEIRKKVDFTIPTSLSLILANANSKTPNFKKVLKDLKLNSNNYWITEKKIK